MNQLQIETQGIERQLTPEELEAIAGGLSWDDISGFIGKVGGGIVAGLSQVGKAEMQKDYIATGDYAGAREIDAKYPSMSEVYNSAKDTVGAKIAGGVTIVAGAAGVAVALYYGGSALAQGLGYGGAAIVVSRTLSDLIEPMPSPPRGLGYGQGGSISSSSSSISGLQINGQSPIGEQLVNKSVGQFCSTEQLQQMGIPADARVVGYVSAKDADANFVKEFKAASGLNDNAKLGYLQVDYSVNTGNSETVIVHKNVPLIDLGEIKGNVVEEPKAVGAGDVTDPGQATTSPSNTFAPLWARYAPKGVRMNFNSQNS